MANSSEKQQKYTLKPVSQAVLAACGASVAVTPNVMAQEVQPLEEVIVTARKRTENLQDVPISVMAFGADAIEKQDITNLEDYARLIPSLTYSSWLPNQAMVIFRGVTVTADSFSGSSSAALYFNELPLTLQGQNPEVSMVDMERIEAVSGPQPTTYGASAQSGVLKFVTAKPDFSEFNAYIDISGSYMEEGDSSYDFQAVANIPVIEDKFALRLVAAKSEVGGFVDNIAGSSESTHDWSPAFNSVPAPYSYPTGFDEIAHVTTRNDNVAEDDIGDVDTQTLRITGAWQLNDNWLVTGLFQDQESNADGIPSWNESLGDLNQIRYYKETSDDEWYVSTLVVEGDLGFADFTSATGFMDRKIAYDLDSSTYLHQFQGIGGVYYNMFDIAYFGTDYASVYTYAIPAYNGSITGWTPGPGPYTYYITELTDVTSRMVNETNTERFSQEFRLTSKADEGQRYNWMVGGFYESYESDYVFRSFLDNYGNSIAGTIIGAQPDGFTVRDPGQSWFGTGTTDNEQWAIFAEYGFDVTDQFSVLLGARYFDTTSKTTIQTLNADGTQAQTCLEDTAGDCVLSSAAANPDSRIGTLPALNEASDDGVLPLVTLNYRFNDNVLGYFTYSEGFRVGGTNVVRAVSEAKDSFDADKLINHEFGLKSTLWNGRFVINAAAFFMDWEDVQLVAADPTIDFGWGQITVNAGEAEIQGVETNFALAATERLSFNGSLSFIDTEVTEGADIGGTVVIEPGEELPLSPEWKASFGGEYSFPLFNNDAYLRFDYTYVDEQTNATQGSSELTSSTLLRGVITTMPSYSVLNLKLGVAGDDWSLSLSLNNVADERAVTYKPTRWTDGRLYSIRPRELVLGFRKNF